jgi:hypothetical protein
MVDMPTPDFKDDDYLFEIKIRVAVRNIDATTVIAQGPKWAKDKTEEAKLKSALFELIGKGLAKHGDLIETLNCAASRFGSVREYRSVIDETFAQFQRGPAKPQLVPPPKPDEKS